MKIVIKYQHGVKNMKKSVSSLQQNYLCLLSKGQQGRGGVAFPAAEGSSAAKKGSQGLCDRLLYWGGGTKT